MPLDVEMYRRTIYAPPVRKGQAPRRISVIDIEPEGATHTLVFVHGYGGNCLQWVNQLRSFSQGSTPGQHMRVVAYDMYGHGLSDDLEGRSYSVESLVDDLELVIDTCNVEKPFSLVSHSFGGAVATEYTLRHPENLSGLVLIGVPTRFVISPLLSRLIMSVPDPLFSFAARKLKIALFAPQRTLKRLFEDALISWRGNERMQQIQVPTLTILGQRDNLFQREHYEDVPRLIAHAQKVVIPVSAHLVQLERPDAVTRAIRRFVESKGLEAARSAQFLAHKNAHSAQRLVEMPWLQHYDDDVLEDVPLPKQSLHDLLSNAARSFRDRPALIFFGQKISYRELDHLTNRFAHALRKLGIKKGDRVVVLLPNIPQFVIAFYGTLKAGATVVLGSPLSNEEEIHQQLHDCEAQVLLTLASYRNMIAQACADTSISQIIYTDVREYLPIRQRLLIASMIEGSEPHRRGAGDGAASSTTAPAAKGNTLETMRSSSFQQLLLNQPTTPLESETTADDLALIQYTSGTTDAPKGVMLSHRNLLVNIIQIRHWMSDARRGREVILCTLPLSHSYGVTSCMNMSMGIAGSMVLLPTTRTDQVLEAIKQHRPSIFPGVPALYLAIANYPRVRSYGVSAIRICISGSAPLAVEVQEAFEKLTRGRLVEGYGLTEASPVTHCNPLKGERRVGSIGIPLPGTTARIADIETGQSLPAGEIGELLICGPQVMQGYWKMPEETAQTLRDGWLHTGDLARMDEDGFFTIVDRKKDLILSGLYNIYPRDVEEVLYEHPKVLEAAVVSAPWRAENGAASNGDSGNSEPASPFIKAVVVLKRGEHATADELLALCRERLDAYKVPKQIEFRSELPKNFVGKVLRRLLIET